jgi:hypothetical protein
VPANPTLLDDVLPTATLHVTAWADPVLDRVGHDPRSTYVEQFWLGILGPSTTWLLRRLADGLDARPDGYDLALEDAARSLGLGMKGGRHSPFVRALVRSCQFRLTQLVDGDGLAVRTRMPSLSRHQLERLPPVLRDAHQAWEQRARQPPDAELRRRRARELALSLLDLGEDAAAVERLLHRWRIHPAMAHEALRWALTHRSAHGLGAEATPPPRQPPAPSPSDPSGSDWAPLGASRALPPRPVPRTPPPRPRTRQAPPTDAA